MARSFRRRRMSGGRKMKRPLDWVVQPETYGLGHYELTAGVVGGIGWESFEVPITAHQDYSSEGDVFVAPNNIFSQRRFPQLEQTVVRIKGSITCWLDPSESWWETRDGYAMLRLRIRKTSQRVESVDPVDPGTTVVQEALGATFANEEFLWEHFTFWIASSSWGDVDMSSAIGPQTIDVDVSTQRRLRVGEQIVLRMDYVTQEAFETGPGAWPMVAINTQLRALMRTIT